MTFFKEKIPEFSFSIKPSAIKETDQNLDDNGMRTILELQWSQANFLACEMFN
jgi:hypothetical protein